MATVDAVAGESIEGTVRKVVFRHRDGYSVLSVQIDGQLLPVNVVGKLPAVEEGETITARGQWGDHPKFGRQFRVASFAAKPPDSEVGLLRYLSSGAIDGVGPALAARLVEAFATELFTIAESAPERLTEVEGIGKKRGAAIAEAIVAQRAARQAMVFLQGLGIGPALAAKVYSEWGAETEQKLSADPYRLVPEIEGIGFATADSIAKNLGVAEDSPTRLVAGLLHLLGKARDLGDTVVVQDKLLSSGEAFLHADRVDLEGALEMLSEQGRVERRSGGDGETMVGLRFLVRAEEGVAKDLVRLSESKPRQVADPLIREACDFDLTDQQFEAVRAAAAGPLAVITGGPGTGKTTVVRTLVQVMERLGERPQLCAPTGRAAKRLSESAGLPAMTVHRLLGYRGGQFEHRASNPLPAGTVIVDEASMLDVLLARQLLQALAEGGRLVLVGDADQLPSVGAGNVLADVIASDVAQVVRLDTIFRQAETSAIVLNAHRIREGQMPEPSATGSNAGGELHRVVVDDPNRAQQLILDICCQRIPKAYGLDPIDDVQVLTPMHRGAVGTIALNELLQQRLNPDGKGLKRGNETLRVGDKVMQVRNDHERDVYNGDIGRIISIDTEDKMLVVDINGQPVEYTENQWGQLALAYCMSIHKSQGSEYPAVIVPLMTQHYMLLQRNLIYTAVTRARTLVVLVGSDKALQMAVSRAELARRETYLQAALSNLF